jgi:pimeloyl-ACP methyl ester carboxylesterase
VSSFVSYDGTVLHYEAVGAGDPLVCLPGGPGRAVAYLEDLGGLSADRTLVLLDPRATGHSDLPSDPSTLRFDRLADDVEALREHLGVEAVDVLGHSAGCFVAQAWAGAHPERVRSLVLVTPSDRLHGGTRSDLPAIRARRADEPWYPDAAAALDALGDAPPSQQGALERELRPFWYGRWDERCQEHAASADRQTSKRAMLGFVAGLDEAAVAELIAGLKSVTAPVLVVAGDLDAMTGVDSAHVVAAPFPNAQVSVVAGAGHYPWVDAPEGFRSAISAFLGTI